MQEIAAPDEQGITDEQRQVPDTLQRDDALPDAAHGGFHLIIYREVLEQHDQKDEYGHSTNHRDNVARSGEFAKNGVDAGTRLLEESAEGRHFQQDSSARDSQHHQHVDSTFSHNRA